MELFGLVMGIIGALAALGATFFSWQAIRAARESVRLQRDERVERHRERLLALLQGLEQATFDWGEKASRVVHGTVPFVAVEARARYQVAYAAAAVELDLPRCGALSKKSMWRK
ncbi:MAG: hypothetical protein ABR529_05295 [Actinomycetota bacterium]